MNRNSNSHFAVNPTNLDIQRSTFDRSSGLKTTFNAGQLIPIFLDEVLPGDTFEMSTAMAVRGSTPIFPVMDNANLDIYYFFVPNRLIWEHWKEFNGENTTSKWVQQIEYSIPQINVPNEGWAKGTIADYMGLPTNEGRTSGTGGVPENWSVSHLPFRAYCLIWNEWYRDENLQDPITINLTDANVQGVNAPAANASITLQNQNALYGGKPLPVNKYFDYFTGALPAPQKGPAVLLPLGATAPVITADIRGRELDYPLRWTAPKTAAGVFRNNDTYQVTAVAPESPSSNATTQGFKTTETTQGISLAPENLEADLSQATAATINELRLAFQIQKLFERDARGGSRYIELLKSHFGVTSPDARLQRPEYLGGERIPINIDQVIQTSETADTPQGNVAAYSLTGNRGSYFKHSFVEHGYILGLACVRTEHSYQQGIEKLWSRKNRFDFYWPALANIGEQAILNKEIFVGTTTAEQTLEEMEEAFGYQEAWAEYRYKPSRISGAFRSNVQGSLDSWHYGDYYSEQPMLSDEWIRETDVNINRTLAVQSELEDQYIADFYFKLKCTRPMPVYSIPGLIDHH